MPTTWQTNPLSLECPSGWPANRSGWGQNINIILELSLYKTPRLYHHHHFIIPPVKVPMVSNQPRAPIQCMRAPSLKQYQNRLPHPCPNSKSKKHYALFKPFQASPRADITSTPDSDSASDSAATTADYPPLPPHPHPHLHPHPPPLPNGPPHPPRQSYPAYEAASARHPYTPHPPPSTASYPNPPRRRPPSLPPSQTPDSPRQTAPDTAAAPADTTHAPPRQGGTTYAAPRHRNT